MRSLVDVTDESSKLDGLTTLVGGLRDRVLELLAGNPELSAQVQAVFDAVEANKLKVQAALDAGVLTQK
jgi:hypothetical protein